jgi:hypothetical protein
MTVLSSPSIYGPDGFSDHWLLGRDGLANKFHHRPRIDNEFGLPTSAIFYSHADQLIVPGLFQQAGWFTFVPCPYSFCIPGLPRIRRPTIAFLLFGVTSAVVSLFLVETMSTIRGNERFQARVEYSTVAHLYLGNKIHIVTQLLLYLALQSVNISSIIISNQVSIKNFSVYTI